MIFSNVSRVHERGFVLDPADLERIGVFDKSVCWGVWAPDPRGNSERRKHLIISPIHPSVWPFLLRMEIKLRRGRIATALKFLVDERINIQSNECAISGHHHATWHVVADANDVRSELDKDFQGIRRLSVDERGHDSPRLQEFSNRLASLMLAKAVNTPEAMVDAHRADESYREGELDSGFLHNRIVDKHLLPFFYAPHAMPANLVEVAEKGLPQAVTCRWMQDLAFFAIYGDMLHPMRLQYDHSTRLLKPAEQSAQGLHKILERQRQPTLLPAAAIAAFDTSGLYLRIEIVEPTEAQTRFFQANIEFDITFATKVVPGSSDTTRGLLLSVCDQLASHGVDVVKLANRTTHRDHQSEAGSISLIGKTATSINPALIGELNSSLTMSCRPEASDARCKTTPKTTQFGSKIIFLSRRMNMPFQDQVMSVLKSIASDWGMVLEDANNRLGKKIDDEVETGVIECDGVLQIVSYSYEEADRSRGEPVVPDLKWLVHEYGMAIGAGKPHIRIFDTTHRTLENWRTLVPIRTNEVAGEYAMYKEDVGLRTKFEPAFAALAQQIARTREETTSGRRSR
ncbi:hypothetical protein [Longimicrobium sp.]|uniref:hypothetical protein n=1 Tax=Longimicrobium sp. TaxID=2029185 RepID=UPI003B3A35FF